MRWRRGERSSDIEDRRGQSISGRFGAGPKLGIGGILTLLALSLIFRARFLCHLSGRRWFTERAMPGIDDPNVSYRR